MKKKLILIGVAVVLVAICVLCILSNVGKTAVNMNMIGTFVYADGTTEAVDFAIEGYIIDTEQETDELFIEFAFSDNFRYSIPTPEPSFVSTNQQYNIFPHLMHFSSFSYDKQANDLAFSNFAIDLEKKYCIVLFDNLADCYLVASQDGEQDYEQLLAYFADYAEFHRPSKWDK